MSGTITVKEGERGLVWVFAVDLDETEIKGFTRKNGTWPVQEALGVDTLDPERVEVFPVSDLEGLGLSGYLEEGLGVPGEQLRDMRARLDAVQGWVLVLTSKAFGGSAQTFTPRAPLRLLASFTEYRTPVTFEPLPSEAAAGTVAGSKTSPPLRRSRGWLGLLLVLGGAAVAITLLALVLS